LASAQVSLSEAGTGEHGTVMSEGGWFTNVALEHADWIVDPGLLDYDDMIWISGDYEDGDDEFHYDIYLRPWGLYWDDMEEDTYPYRYTDWYLSDITVPCSPVPASLRLTCAEAMGSDLV